jgi:hypothetical protein
MDKVWSRSQLGRTPEGAFERSSAPDASGFTRLPRPAAYQEYDAEDRLT